MMELNTILVPLFPEDRRSLWRFTVVHALAVAERLKLNAHFIAPAAIAAEVRRRIPANVPFHECSGDFTYDILKEIQTHRADCVFCEYRPWHSFTLLSAAKRRLIEASPVPVLMVPSSMVLAEFDMKSVMVPLSGERHGSGAVELGVRLGNTLNVPVNLMHVTLAERVCSCGAQFLEFAGDEIHHEYEAKVDQLVAEGSPFSSPRERQSIRTFVHTYGDVTHEIVRAMKRSPKSLLIMEWKGEMARGRAKILRKVLRRIRRPIFITKPRPAPSFRLKVGKEFR